MNKPHSKGHLFFRSLIVYVVTIFFGTLVTALILSEGGSHDFDAFFLFGLIFTGLASLPNILLLFGGFYFIYKYFRAKKEIYFSLVGLGIILCVLPVVLFIAVTSGGNIFGSGIHQMFEFSMLAIPYCIIALLTILGVNYSFDMIRGLETRREEDENLLDDVIDVE